MPFAGLFPGLCAFIPYVLFHGFPGDLRLSGLVSSRNGLAFPGKPPGIPCARAWEALARPRKTRGIRPVFAGG